MPCSTCRTQRMVSIAVKVGEAELTMHSCNACDRRFWERNGERIALDGVLGLASRR